MQGGVCGWVEVCLPRSRGEKVRSARGLYIRGVIVQGRFQDGIWLLDLSPEHQVRQCELHLSLWQEKQKAKLLQTRKFLSPVPIPCLCLS